jgi:Zn-dependent membrane protease YugP
MLLVMRVNKMKIKVLMALVVLFSVVVLPVEAATSEKRVCTSDSYGNQTCHTEVTNVETGQITYKDEEVILSTQTIAYQDGVQTTEILNASVPGYVTPLAVALVVAGGASFLLKGMMTKGQ